MRSGTVICVFTIVMMALGPIGTLMGPAAGDAMNVHWLSDGSPGADITFNGAGDDTSLSLSIRKSSVVTSLSMDVQGLPKSLGGYDIYEHDHNTTNGKGGWSGTSAAMPPTTKTACRDSAFGNMDWPATASIDGTDKIASSATGGHHACIALEYTLDSDMPSELEFKFYGWGDAETGLGLNIYFWNFTAGQYRLVTNYTEPPTDDRWLNGTVDANATDYVEDSTQKLYVMVMTAGTQKPISVTLKTFVWMDFAKVIETVPQISHPTDVHLDIGNDGDIEWSATSGDMTSLETISGSVAIDELQALIDAAGIGNDNVTVPLKFHSGAEGILRVGNIDIGITENMPPDFIGGVDPIHVDEDSAHGAFIDMADHFTDDLQDPEEMSYAVINMSDDTKVMVTLNADGHSLDVTTPTANWYGTESFQVEATDNAGHKVLSDPIEVVVDPVNDPPVLDPIDEQTATEDVPFELEVTAKDGDLGFQGDVLTFSISNPLAAIAPKPGTNDTAVVSLVPTDAMVGTSMFTVSVHDQKQFKDSLSFNITVSDVNHAPVFDPFGDQEAVEGKDFKKRVSVKDKDTKDAHTFSDDTGMFDIDGASGWIEFTPQQEDVGRHTVTITVSDGRAGTDLAINFTVLNVNDPPAVDDIDDDDVDRNLPWTYTAQATDPDLGYDEDENLTFSLTANPVFLNATIDPATGVITILPVLSDAGSHKIKVTVTDAAGMTGTAEFNLTVNLVNFEPVATIKVTTAGGEEGKAKAGENITLEAVAADPDGDELTYEWTWTDGIEMNAKGALITINMDEKGEHVINLTVSDGIETITVSTTIEVTGSGGGGGGTGAPGFEALSLIVVLLAVALVALGRRMEA